MGVVKSLNKIDDLQFLYRGDFPVIFGKQDSTLNVFKLLETACLHLAVVSLKMRTLEAKGRLSYHLVYKRMVWGMLLVL